MGIRTIPADARAMAPVARFARFESLGSEEEWVGFPPCSTTPMERRRFDRATFCLKAFKPVKYMAEPRPVRRADGAVPRQKERMEFDDLEISRIVDSKELEPDCWTRVLRRSAGCSRTAERTPEPSPATKWNAAGNCQCCL